MATTNRTVSFVSHLNLELGDGKVLPHAVTLGDVDNNGGNELVVGTTDGRLYVFRGHCNEPWCSIANLGAITCVGIGDILQSEMNSVIILNTEGICYIYNFIPTRVENSGANYDRDQKQQPAYLKHKQLLSTNAKMILLGDIDGDGNKELVIAHTDRYVSSYRWNKSSRQLNNLQEWRLRQSVGSITLHNMDEDDQPKIIASQPGCAFATLHPVSEFDESKNSDVDDSSQNNHLSYFPMSSLSRSQNPAISCQIVGNICKGLKEEKGYFALCTLDGNIKLIEDDEILWSFQVDHQLFAMNKLDVLGNRKEEVIVCAWDGLTYIVDHDRNVVRYQYEDNVQAFCAGQYAIEDEENVVCLVYIDFKNRLKLYYDIQLPQLRITDFLMEIEKDEEIKKLVAEFGADTDKKKRDLIRYCMYGIQSDTCSGNDDSDSDKQVILPKQDEPPQTLLLSNFYHRGQEFLLRAILNKGYDV